jgi:hypothetical protein
VWYSTVSTAPPLRPKIQPSVGETKEALSQSTRHGTPLSLSGGVIGRQIVKSVVR